MIQEVLEVKSSNDLITVKTQDSTGLPNKLYEYIQTKTHNLIAKLKLP